MLESRFTELYVNVHVEHKKLYHKMSLVSILRRRSEILAVFKATNNQTLPRTSQTTPLNPPFFVPIMRKKGENPILQLEAFFDQRMVYRRQRHESAAVAA
jgi:hypothetical protein